MLRIEATAFGEAEEMILFVELWVTVRGFSFLSGWIKQYKRLSKMTAEEEGSTL